MTAFLSPCGGSGGSSPLISPEEALVLIGEHLGAESDAAPPPSCSSPSSKVVVDLKEGQREPGKNNACRNPLRFSCPALSLAHKDHLDMDHSSRKEAERYAVSLLSRPLLVGETEHANEVGFPCVGLPEVPAVLLRNIYESFAMLVDSRLRAYATFLARHCDTLARSKKKNLHSAAPVVGVLNVEQKLGTLLGLGSRIEASSMRTIFEVAETGADDDEEDKRDECLKHKSSSLPLRMKAVINLVVPGPSGEVDTLSVTHKTTGVISGLFTPGSSKPNEVHVTLDTKELLSSMMLQAARVVALVVELTNRAYGLVPDEPKLPRGDSYLVMPPPMSKNQLSLQQEQQQQLATSGDRRKLDEAMTSWVGVTPSELPIVSPDLFALNSPHKPMPHLFLDYQKDGVFDPVDYLSPDQCADVVDGVFGVLDDSIFMGPPASKKLKSSDCP